MSSDTIAPDMLGEYKDVVGIFYLVKDAALWCNDKAASAPNQLFVDWKKACTKADENNLAPFIDQADVLLQKCDAFCQRIVKYAGIVSDNIGDRLVTLDPELKGDKKIQNHLAKLQELYEERVHSKLVRLFERACELESGIRDMRDVSIISEIARKKGAR